MNLLLDTHTLFWFIIDDNHLPTKIKTLIEDTSNSCHVSIASLWELGIKHSLGKLHLNASLATIFKLISASGLDILPIQPNHILELS